MNKKEEIIKLRKSGYSYNEIVKKIHVSKRDVIKFGRNVKFSREGYKRYHKKVKGIEKLIKKQSKYLTLPKVRVIGHLLFDGSLNVSKEGNYQLMYINASNKLVREFCKDVRKVYGLKPSIFNEQTNIDIYRAKCSSKMAYNNLIKYTPSYSTSSELANVPEEIVNNKKILIEFLRTFWDDEGSISKSGVLQGCLKSNSIIDKLYFIHKNLGFDVRKYIDKSKEEPSYILRILKTKENLNRFYEFKLFTHSIATRGYFKGMKKIDILRQFI